jgi:hypothetical protein
MLLTGINLYPEIKGVETIMIEKQKQYHELFAKLRVFMEKTRKQF